MGKTKIDKEVNSKVELEISKSNEKTEKSAKREKFFIFSKEEIEAMPDRLKNIVLEKKNTGNVARGAPFFTWKLAVAAKVAQTQPWILKWEGINGTICSLCGCTVKESARCSWMDRHFNFTTKQHEEKPFQVRNVCENCLSMVKAKFIHEAELLSIVLSNKDKASYVGLHNMKDYVCQFCEDHQTDSTCVQIPWENKLISIPVCDRHFDAIITPKPVVNGVVVEAEQWQKEGLLSAKTLESLKAFQRLKN